MNTYKIKEDISYDVIIVGTGVAGLMAALSLPSSLRVLMITKLEAEKSNSYLAQGGVAVLRDTGDYKAYFEDTLRAGHYENSEDAVRYMITHSRALIEQLDAMGVPFDRMDGELEYTKEGAHSKHRIVHHKDITGRVIMETLLKSVRALPNVWIKEHTEMVDWIVDARMHIGGILAVHKQQLVPFYSNHVVLATGGIGGRYDKSTNYAHIVGDSLRLAKQYHVPLSCMDYVQIHPTTLYTDKKERSFLISEAVRGEGGILLNHQGERFVDELLPRDKVCEAIEHEMRQEGKKYVYLSFERIPEARIKKHFPSIYQHCLEEGYDVTKEPVPVVPAQHYFMGGITVNLEGKTGMKGLYAVGETSCTGVHGKNRLASNSLLEAMLFGKRVAVTIVEAIQKEKREAGYQYEKCMG